MVYGLSNKDADPTPGTPPGPGDRLCCALRAFLRPRFSHARLYLKWFWRAILSILPCRMLRRWYHSLKRKCCRGSVHRILFSSLQVHLMDGSVGRGRHLSHAELLLSRLSPALRRYSSLRPKSIPLPATAPPTAPRGAHASRLPRSRPNCRAQRTAESGSGAWVRQVRPTRRSRPRKAPEPAIPARDDRAAWYCGCPN